MSGVARSHRKPGSSQEILFSNCELFNPCTCSWEHTSFIVSGGRIRNFGESQRFDELDLKGARVIPGLIDAHVHIESSLLCPSEFGRLVLSHGVTTVVADPHEIANVLGVPGLLYMLDEAANTPLDIFLMLPSCVPASNDDRGGAVITADDLIPLLGHEKVLGLGEVMDVDAVLRGDSGMEKKLRLTRLIDGHAPGLRGEQLDRYLHAGIESDHECTTIEEAQEKLMKGMFIMIREGTLAKNLRDLLPLVTGCSLPRLSFVTDDRPADSLVYEGSVDDCIRLAISEGIEIETALRMATLSPCDRFMLRDRGMVSPGKIADFCILDSDESFLVSRIFKWGCEVTRLPYQEPSIVRHTFHAMVPEEKALQITGEGSARIMKLRKGQILTQKILANVEGNRLPDLTQDILLLLVCSRYRPGNYGLGLVHGFGLQEGALASSVGHDAHNVIAVGTDICSLRKATNEVISKNGAMVAVTEKGIHSLPLACAGLMSSAPYEKVAQELSLLERTVFRMGGIERAFMYLSFLTLSVVPELRLTEKGLYDVSTRRYVPLFVS